MEPLKTKTLHTVRMPFLELAFLLEKLPAADKAMTHNKLTAYVEEIEEATGELVKVPVLL